MFAHRSVVVQTHTEGGVSPLPRTQNPVKFEIKTRAFAMINFFKLEAFTINPESLRTHSVFEAPNARWAVRM